MLQLSLALIMIAEQSHECWFLGCCCLWEGSICLSVCPCRQLIECSPENWTGAASFGPLTHHNSHSLLRLGSFSILYKAGWLPLLSCTQFNTPAQETWSFPDEKMIFSSSTSALWLGNRGWAFLSLMLLSLPINMHLVLLYPWNVVLAHPRCKIQVTVALPESLGYTGDPSGPDLLCCSLSVGGMYRSELSPTKSWQTARE